MTAARFAWAWAGIDVLVLVLAAVAAAAPDGECAGRGPTPPVGPESRFERAIDDEMVTAGVRRVTT